MDKQKRHSPEKVTLPKLKVRIAVWLFSPPGRRSETLGCLYENYHEILNDGRKHGKERADAWADSEALEIISHSPHRHYWTAYKVLRRAGRALVFYYVFRRD